MNAARVRGDASIVSPVPLGLSQQRVPSLLAHLCFIVEHRGAADVMTGGVCGACLLGSDGTLDPALRGSHHCPPRWLSLRAETLGPFPPHLLSDVARLREQVPPRALRDLGRVSHPFVRYPGKKGFERIDWDRAGRLARSRIGDASLAFSVDPRGLGNEALWTIRRAAELTDSSVHVRGTAGLAAFRAMLGSLAGSAAPAPITDLLGADVILLWGTNPALTAPDLLRYLHYAKRRGTRVVAINPCREPGVHEAWIPTIPRSAWFGSRLVDDWLPVRPGGDAALALATLATLNLSGGVDHGFVTENVEGWRGIEAMLAQVEVWSLQQRAGARLHAADWLAEVLGGTRSIISVLGDGVGTGDALAAIAALHVARGAIDRADAGFIPLFGHPGSHAALDLGLASAPGSAPAEAVYVVGDGLDGAAGGAPPVRVHQVTHLDASVLADGELVLVLPSQTATEIEATHTSATDRIRWSTRLLDPHEIGHARPPWEVTAFAVRSARPHLAGTLRPRTAAELRADLAEHVPAYADCAHLGPERPWTRVRRAAMSRPLRVATFDADVSLPPQGQVRVVARRGYASGPGARRLPQGLPRDAVLIDPSEASTLQLDEGVEVRIILEDGTDYLGVTVFQELGPRHVQVYLPEARALFASGGVVNARIELAVPR